MAERGTEVPGAVVVPELRQRIVVAILIAVACGAFTFAVQVRHPEVYAYDWTWHWRAGRALLAGLNPYDVVRDRGGIYPFDHNYYYPLPAAFLGAPVALLFPALSSALAIVFCSGLLAFAVTREAWYPLVLFLSAPFVMGAAAGAAHVMLITAGVARPAMQAFVIMKPNIGLAVFGSRPSWWGPVGGLVLAGIAFLLVPTWAIDLLNALHGEKTTHLAPVRALAGFVLLLSLLRWRRPEARLVFLMALVPQTLTFHDVLPLMLVPRSLRQALILSLSSAVALLLALPIMRENVEQSIMFARTAPIAVWLIYVPALVMVLVRPNEGNVPAWVDRLTPAWPRWMRGAGVAPVEAREH